MKMELIRLDDKARWNAAVRLCNDYDVYHLNEFHEVASKMGEGRPYLFVFEANGDYAVVPFLLRAISEFDGLKDFDFNDATSVYGYPGIITSLKADNPRGSDFLSKFQTSFGDTLKSLRIICYFSRLNPLITSNWLFEGFGETIYQGNTVVIRLSADSQCPMSTLSKGHKYDIKKAKAAGVVVRESHDFSKLDVFIKSYYETMDRTGALGYYYFSPDYFLSLKEFLGDSLKLFYAELDGSIIASSMFLTSNKIIQYHLSGTPTEYIKTGGAKVIIEEVCKWGSQRGFQWLHLGGGLAGKEDLLFRFKAGFSKERLPFYIKQAVIQPDLYNLIVSSRQNFIIKNHYSTVSNNYFPEYRTPIKKDATIEF